MYNLDEDVNAKPTCWKKYHIGMQLKEGYHYVVGYNIYETFCVKMLYWSNDLSKIDKYDFPKHKYKNKSGFYYYDSEYGYLSFCDKDILYYLEIPFIQEDLDF